MHPLERITSMRLTSFEFVARFVMMSTFPRVGSAPLGLLMDPVPLTGTKLMTKGTTTLPLPMTQSIPSIPHQLDHPSNPLVIPSLPQGRSHSRSHLNVEKVFLSSTYSMFSLAHWYSFLLPPGVSDSCLLFFIPTSSSVLLSFTWCLRLLFTFLYTY